MAPCHWLAGWAGKRNAVNAEFMNSTTVFVFEDFSVDHRSGLSRQNRSGAWQPVALGSRALQVLCAFMENPGVVISRDALLATAWAGVTVEEANLTVQISTLRRILDHGRSGNSCIQTVIGRGYRFALPVRRRRAPVSSGSRFYGEDADTHQTYMPGQLETGANCISNSVADYQALFDGLMIEHEPVGPTQEYLVEELAKIIWRKRESRKAAGEEKTVRIASGQMLYQDDDSDRAPAGSRVACVRYGGALCEVCLDHKLERVLGMLIQLRAWRGH
jgi:DNA-binding winged helix-turn-helix (wHTH) protein